MPDYAFSPLTLSPCLDGRSRCSVKKENAVQKSEVREKIRSAVA